MRRIGSVIALGALVVTLAACDGGGGGSDGTAAQQVEGPVEGRTARRATTTTFAPTTTTSVPTSPDQLHPPTSAEAVVAELVRVERALRADGPDARSRLALGWAQQLAYGALSSHPEWTDAVVAALPDDVAPTVRANHDAAVHLAAPNLGPPPTELPDWTIRRPQPIATLVGYYHEAELQSGIPWAYLAAVHFVETRMGRIHGNSGAGAQGPMQFIPSTWAAYGSGGDVNDDRDAILAAGRFLAASGGATDIARALYAYNPSDDYVAAVQDYAGVIAADPRAYDGYYAWQVYVTTTSGTQRLPEGWTRS